MDLVISIFKQKDGVVLLEGLKFKSFLGAVAGQGGTKGLFITTSSFTKDAIDFTKKQLQVKLILVDGKMLTKLMMEYNLGVSIRKCV